MAGGASGIQIYLALTSYLLARTLLIDKTIKRVLRLIGFSLWHVAHLLCDVTRLAVFPQYSSDIKYI